MRLSNRQFTPRPWVIVLYALLLLCMLWLGKWQLNRAALKVSMAQAAEAARNAQAIDLSSIADIGLASASFTRVQLSGRYDAAHQFLWDNRTHQGRAGFEVLVPLKLANGQVVLVNRGWTAPGPSRSQLPDVSLPPSALTERVHIEGLLSSPSQGFASGEPVADGDSWPRLLQYLDYEAVSQALGTPVVPALVQAQSLAEDGYEPTVLTERPEWLIANWQPAASGPAKHYGYAFQWFAMAAGLTVLFIVVNTRKKNDLPDQRTET